MGFCYSYLFCYGYLRFTIVSLLLYFHCCIFIVLLLLCHHYIKYLLMWFILCFIFLYLGYIILLFPIVDLYFVSIGLYSLLELVYFLFLTSIDFLFHTPIDSCFSFFLYISSSLFYRNWFMFILS